MLASLRVLHVDTSHAPATNRLDRGTTTILLDTNGVTPQAPDQETDEQARRARSDLRASYEQQRFLTDATLDP
jgi:hypothetical protein